MVGIFHGELLVNNQMVPLLILLNPIDDVKWPTQWIYFWLAHGWDIVWLTALGKIW